MIKPQRRAGVLSQIAFTVFFQRLSLGKSPTTESDGCTIGAEKEKRTVMLGQDIIHAAINS